MLDTPIEYLKGIGPQRAEVLKKEFENADKSSNIDQQSTEDIQIPQIDIPLSPSTKKKNSNQ